MDTVDASIPLQAKSGFDAAEFMSLAEMAQKMRIQQQAVQSQNALKQVFTQPGAIDDQGNPTAKTIQQTLAIDPETGMKLRESTLSNQAQVWHSKLYQTQLGQIKADKTTGIAAAGVNAYNDALASGLSKAEASAAGSKARNEAAAASGGALDEAEITRITSTPFQFDQAKILAGLNPDYVAQQNTLRAATTKDETPFEREAASLYGKGTPAYKAALEKHVNKLDAPPHVTVNTGGPGGAKLQSGYMWDPNNPGHEIPIPGGTRDGVEVLTPAMGDLMASLSVQGISLPVGYRSKEQQARLYDGLLRKFPDSTPDEIATNIKNGQIDLKAMLKETQTAAGMAGKVAVAENEIKQFVPLALDASSKVPRGKFVPINKLMQTAETAISDPNLKVLKIRLNAVMNAYDQLAARGGTDQNKRDEAHKLLLSADSPEALAAGLEAFTQEANAAEQAALAATKPQKIAAPKKNAKGWGLQVDAKGNKAYVGPNGEIEEVQ